MGAKKQRKTQKGGILDSLSLIFSKKRRLTLLLSAAGILMVALIIIVARFFISAETVSPSATTGGNCKYLLSYGTDNGATPSYIAGHIQQIETNYPYDGVGINGWGHTENIFSPTAVSYSQIKADFQPLFNLMSPTNTGPKPTKLIHNFVIVYTMGEAGDVYNDSNWNTVAQNFANLAQVLNDLKATGFGIDGIMYDNEGPYNKIGGAALPSGYHNFFMYPGPYFTTSHTLAEYQVQTRLRGKQLMQASIAKYPTIKLLYFQTAKFSCTDDDQYPYNQTLGSFALGMLEATVGTPAKVYDGGEDGYYLSTSNEFLNYYNVRKNIPNHQPQCAFVPQADRAMWPTQLGFDFGLYNGSSSASDETSIQQNATLALNQADSYVWFYVEGVTTIGNGTQIGQAWTNGLAAARAAVPNDSTCGTTPPPTETIPSAPSNLSATTFSSSQINLSWADNSSNETGFKIERSLTSGSGFSQIATVGAGVTTYQNTSLSVSTTYYYQVRAYNTAGDSAYSNEANATTSAIIVQPPAAPSNLSATTISDTQINLSWTDNSSNESGFKIERKTGTAAYQQVGTAGPGVTSYNNTGLTPSTTYYYRVWAYNAGGNSAKSNEVNATTGAGPTADKPDLTITALTMSPSSPATGNEVTFSATIKNQGTAATPLGSAGGTFLGVAFKIDGVWVTWSDNYYNSLAPGASITLTPNYGQSGKTTWTAISGTHTLAAVVDNMSLIAESSESNNEVSQTITVGPTQDATPPSAPTSLNGTAGSSTQISLNWTGSTDNVGVIGYYIYRGGVRVGSTSSVFYTDSNLTAGTTYTYQVSAFDTANNESAKSNQISVATPIIPDNPPSITINNPTNGATVSGTINITVTAADDKSVTKVDYYLDSVFVSSNSITPFSSTLNTTDYANGTHALKARVYDSSGQFTDDNHTITINNPLPTAVVISGVRVSVTRTTATISWSTNVPATSQVKYGGTTGYGNQTPLNTALVTSHSVTITGLSRKTIYYFQIISTNASSTDTFESQFRTTGWWWSKPSIFF